MPLVASLALLACAPAEPDTTAGEPPSHDAAEAANESAGAPATDGIASLSGTAWLLEDLGGTGVVDRVRATIEFGEDGSVAGSASCNRFTGSASIRGDSIALGPLATTRRACPEAVRSQEQRYLAALDTAHRWRIDGAFLEVHAGSEDGPLRFTPTGPE